MIGSFDQRENIIDVKQKLSEELAKLSVWLIDNNLSLHLGKTESLLFPSGHGIIHGTFPE